MGKRKPSAPDQPDAEETEPPPGPSGVQTQSKKVRISSSAVHEEYEQQETVNRDKKELIITSKCKHCVGPGVQIFRHRQCSELKRHLRNCHPDVFKRVELQDMKQKEEKIELQAVPKSRNDMIQECFNSWLTVSGASMSTPDHPLFRKFISLMDDTVKIPGAKGQLNYSYRKYILLEQKMKEILAECSKVHLTMDMWSSKSSNDSFLGITVHCWDNTAKARRNFRLCLRTFNERHTAPNIIEKVTKILDEFNIRAKVRSVNTDNGANIRR